MLDNEENGTAGETVEAAPAPAKKAARKAPARKTAKKAAADQPAPDAAAGDQPLLELPEAEAPPAEAPAKKTAAKKAAAKKTTKKAAAKKAAAPAAEAAAADPVADAAPAEAVVEADEQPAAPAKKAAAKRTRTRKTAAAADPAPATDAPAADEAAGTTPGDAETAGAAVVPVFQAPTTTTTTRSRRRPASSASTDASAETTDESTPAAAEDEAEQPAPKARRTRKKAAAAPESEPTDEDDATDAESTDAESPEGSDAESDDNDDASDDDGSGQPRRRRRRGGRRRRKSSDQGDDNQSDDNENEGSSGVDAAAEADGERAADADGDNSDSDEATGSRRRRRRRRAGDSSGDGSGDDPANTVTKVRQARSAEDQITAVSGSTRLEAKKQRRREGREAGRRRAPIVSEAEFLARRESVDRQMVVRQKGELTQIGVLEDKVLVEHYVSRESQNSLIGNVYVGRVQNVLPSMEAAFVDIGKGRNAVLYAGEVNWSALGHKEGQPRKIESVLSSGQAVLVQVTKDPIGHKGARLTSQVSLAGRFLVYVPDGTTSGISRKLPDTERARLKSLLKEIVPETAGVIVRTAAEGASEDELTRDVERLKARWEDIEAKSKTGSAPKLLYGEPDLTLKVVRDLFTEDFASLVVEGDEAWETVHGYVEHMAPDLLERVHRFEPADDGRDSFAAHRIDEQIAKGIDRKVWLPSGGSLIIDRTEAMTVVDVNTGKFTGSGGNLEETVTKNNLEAAEEIVRQLRLRDIGGIIVVDFIDMVLESNRDLVLRRLVECLGRDRTRHQVAEVTSLGLVQMTRKRIGTGLLEAFSENCEHCAGRGVVVHEMPIEPKRGDDDGRRSNRRGRGKGDQQQRNENPKPMPPVTPPSPKDVAAAARPESARNTAEEAVEGNETTADAPQAEQPTAAVAEPTVRTTTRSRGRSRRQSAQDTTQESKSEPTETSAAAPAAQDAPADRSTGATRVESAPEAPAAATAVAEPAAASTGVVTRTRRAARSGGVITPKQAEPVVVAPTPPPAPEGTPVAAPPKVVTRTRGRRTATAAGAESTSQAASIEVQGDAAELHVPIKKKGSRKR